jgi:hypothetical protein
MKYNDQPFYFFYILGGNGLKGFSNGCTPFVFSLRRQT